MKINSIEAKSILNPTGGFLSSYTHTINPYIGCHFGLGLCGVYCYAKAIAMGIRRDERKWGTYVDTKSNAARLYRNEYVRIRKKGPLKIFMSSVTDPYPPIEKNLSITHDILEAMIDMPPDVLVIQTHTPNVLWDLDVIKELNRVCSVGIQISVETDMENSDLEKFHLSGLRHIYSISSRLDALKKIMDEGILSIATISPLLPLNNMRSFAEKINSSSNYAILDHFLLGDGSNGRRTSSTNYFEHPLPLHLEENGFGKWNTLSQFYIVGNMFKDVMGSSRVGFSQEGFNHIFCM